MLIEDDEVDQMLLKFMIEDQGAEMTLETDKDMALEKLKSSSFDLILLDTRINKINALELTKKLRSDMKLDIPIIGLSSTDLKGRGIHSGLDEVLIRPVEYQNFINALSRLIRD